MRGLNIVMYHYVRPLSRSPWPKLKALELEEFEAHLRYLAEHATVIGMEQLILALQGKQDLPEKATLLSFDDGLLDHFVYVLPLLRKYGMTAAFYPSYASFAQGQFLDVHRLHWLLAKVPWALLIKQFQHQLKAEQKAFALASWPEYYEYYAAKSSLDKPQVLAFKRLLQRDLPIDLRKQMLQKIWDHFLEQPQATVHEQWYMSLDQIKCLHDLGMHIGAHGYEHQWLSDIPCEQWPQEVDWCKQGLKLIGADLERWTYCYPYGQYEPDFFKTLKGQGCVLALGTKPQAFYDLNQAEAYALPRIDARDFWVSFTEQKQALGV